MNYPWILITVCALAFLPYSQAKNHLSYDVLEDRFEAMPLPLEADFGSHIAGPIQMFLLNGRRECEKMLGRATLYYPIFEHYLKFHELPEMLKYLPIVESRLFPMATSSAGAAGLWQFMPGTAKMYRLEISEYVDERLSPYRSTEMAVKLLSDLHDEFGDWLLALAAYNCGPGRVHRAIKREKCDNYWDIAHHLPRQTRKYIPRFLAAVYVFRYYGLHGLQPEFPHPDLQSIRTVKMYRYTTFAEIARICRVSERTLQDLNPGFLQGVIPHSRRGHVLAIPARVMPRFHYHFSDRMGGNAVARSEIPLIIPPDRYVVEAGDSLEMIAQNYECQVEDLIRWNNLAQPEILVSQELKLYPANLLSTPLTRGT